MFEIDHLTGEIWKSDQLLEGFRTHTIVVLVSMCYFHNTQIHTFDSSYVNYYVIERSLNAAHDIRNNQKIAHTQIIAYPGNQDKSY